MEADPPAVKITIPPTSSAQDADLVSKLTHIVNTVYTRAEEGIFKPGYRRTHDAEMSDYLKSGQLAVAYLNEEPVGCVFIKFLTTDKGQFGMLALSPKLQGLGMGKKMAVYAEDYCREKGCTIMQLELLMPATFEHAGKLRNQAWYLRMGYEIVRLGDFRDDYPALEPLLCGPTEYRVFEKRLV